MADIKTASRLRSHILDMGREVCQELSETQLKLFCSHKLLLKSTQWKITLPGSLQDIKYFTPWRAQNQKGMGGAVFSSFSLLPVFLVLENYTFLKKATVSCDDIRNKLIKQATLLIPKKPKKFTSSVSSTSIGM